jgi:hypothetical protein
MDGKAEFWISGGRLRAQVRIPGKALPSFLAQPALHGSSFSTPGMEPYKPPSEAIIAAEIPKAAAAPAKPLTADEIDSLDMNLMMPSERGEGYARAWNMHQVQHWYQAKTFPGSIRSIGIMVNQMIRLYQ